MPTSAGLEDWLWVGLCGILVALTLVRGIIGIFRTLYPIEQPDVGWWGFIGMLFMLAALVIIAMSFLGDSRYGSWADTLVIAALLTTPLYLVGEALLSIDRARKRSASASSRDA